MRVKLAMLVAGLGVAVVTAAPTYEVTKVVGDHDFLFSFRQNAEAAFTAPQDNTLSAWRPLPFAWKFFGKEVAGYFISDNGYITFDRDAKASVATPVALTDAKAPKNSIFGYWSDLRLDPGASQWTGAVWTATMGAAPARVHVIYFMSVTAAGGAAAGSTLGFIIALYESGEFEVIYTSTRKSGTLSAVVGATSADGAQVTAAGPGFDFPAVGFGGEDDVTFRFTPVNK